MPHRTHRRSTRLWRRHLLEVARRLRVRHNGTAPDLASVLAEAHVSRAAFERHFPEGEQGLLQRLPELAGDRGP